MTRDEIRKLMGGYATGTLTEAERKLLFEAALDDQELFEELAGEQALKELIETPGVRARLLESVAPVERTRARSPWWAWGAVGVAVSAGLVLFVVTREREAPVAVDQVAAMKSARADVEPERRPEAPRSTLKDAAPATEPPPARERPAPQQGQQGNAEKDAAAGPPAALDRIGRVANEQAPKLAQTPPVQDGVREEAERQRGGQQQAAQQQPFAVGPPRPAPRPAVANAPPPSPPQQQSLAQGQPQGQQQQTQQLAAAEARQNFDAPQAPAQNQTQAQEPQLRDQVVQRAAGGKGGAAPQGQITGAISDPVGGVIPGALVRARNLTTGADFQTASTETGNYTLAPLPVGRYQITVNAPGFQQFVRDEFAVQLAQAYRVDVPLQLGTAAETVAVTAETALLKAESGVAARFGFDYRRERTELRVAPRQAGYLTVTAGPATLFPQNQVLANTTVVVPLAAGTGDVTITFAASPGAPAVQALRQSAASGQVSAAGSGTNARVSIIVPAGP